MTTELLPTNDAELLGDLEPPTFTTQQIAFFRAILTVTQKERLGLALDPHFPPEYLMAHASLVGKEQQIQWIIDSAEAANNHKIDAADPFSTVAQTAKATEMELSVLTDEILNS